MDRDPSNNMLKYFADKWEDGEAFAKKIRLFASRNGITVPHALWIFAHFGASGVDLDGRVIAWWDIGFNDYLKSHIEAFSERQQ